MANIKMTISYDGTAYQGWQIQKSGPTLEGSIVEALERMHKHPISINAAGRTDSGVHANGQVINFHTNLDRLPPETFCRAVNNFFPRDIRVKQVEYVHDDFHARFDARIRSYKYYLLPGELPLVYSHLYSLRVVNRLNIPYLNRLASVFIGRHDFTTFSVPNEQVPNKLRTIYNASFAIEGPYVVFWISAPSFLWKMVRSIVGSILFYAQEGKTPQEIKEYLQACDRTLAGPTAPPWGLFLHKVVYKDEPLLF